MMASLGHLTDDELRSKLKEFGINSPVTANTKTVLLKKLNHLITSKKHEPINSQSRPNYKDSTTTSTGEPVPKGIRSGRHTRKDPFLVDESPVRVSPRSRVSVNKKNLGPASTSRSTLLESRRTNLSGFSSDEDDTDGIYENTHKKGVRKFNIEDAHESSRTKNLSEGLSFEKKFPVVRKRTGYSPSFREVKNSPRSSNYEDSFDSESEPEISNERDSGRLKYNSIKFFNAGKSVFSNNIFPRHEDNNISHSRLPLNSKLKNDQNNYEFQNNDTSSFYGGKDPGEITSPDDIVFQEPINNTSSISNSISNNYGQNTLGKAKSLILEHCSIDKEFWLPSVPILLVILLTLFFCFLGICYVSIHTPLGPSNFLSFFNILKFFQHTEKIFAFKDPKSDAEEFISGKKKDVFPMCELETKADCLSKMEMENVPQILGLLGNVIVPALSEHSGLYQCGKVPLQYLTVKEMLELVSKNLPNQKAEPFIMMGLQGLGKLVMFNPHWGLIAVREITEDSTHDEELKGFGLASNSIEILCLLKFSLQNLLYFVFAVFVVVFALWISFKTYTYFMKQAEEVEQKSYELVEQILEVLESSCGTSGKDFIAVNHVRDCLIPPRERIAKSKIWHKAVSFIDDHDSRVYREVRSVGGEDCEVWRWVSGAPRSPVSCSKNNFELDSNHLPEKVWQGQAFESLETTQNVPFVSPTSCLKIRNMFDYEIEFGDHWPSRIQDSLLEKCEGITITHVAVDRASKEGCVYVKCGSPAEAGKAYRALHGWWFDGKLVTVKYLREERYFERFPTARISSTPLTPSNNQRLSLQPLSPSSAVSKR